MKKRWRLLSITIVID